MTDYSKNHAPECLFSGARKALPHKGNHSLGGTRLPATDGIIAQLASRDETLSFEARCLAALHADWLLEHRGRDFDAFDPESWYHVLAYRATAKLGNQL